jgi:hypothetical protein
LASQKTKDAEGLLAQANANFAEMSDTVSELLIWKVRL